MEKILEMVAQVPPLESYISYGTAGFRTLASKLPMVAFKAGLVALMRASQTNKYVGAMITASHNPRPDNGLKMVDPTGEMFSKDWETFTERFVNGNLEEFRGYVTSELSGTIILGYDTRPSSPELAQYFTMGVESAGGSVINLGLVTTPQLHHAVKQSNILASPQTTDLYINHYVQNIEAALQGTSIQGKYETELVLDVAGGVGQFPMEIIKIPGLNLRLINTDSEFLNTSCGSDYVFTKRVLPRDGVANTKSASFDGDADRLVYYKETDRMLMLGGDKLTLLYASALKVFAEMDNVECPINVVTSAYTNNACVNYFRELGIQVTIVATGVKHLHEEAKKHPLSIYFEANGHGTVLVSEDFLQELQRKGAASVLKFVNLSNDTVGDAVADLLMAEVSLRTLGWDLDQWESQYQDLPSTLIGCPSSVKDSIKNTPDETTVLEPPELVEFITNLKNEYAEHLPKIVVRPSGTEPIVRIYVESTSQPISTEIAEALKKAVE